MDDMKCMIQVGLVMIGKNRHRFLCTGFEPYTRTDGEDILLAVWRTECRVCEAAFNQVSSSRILDPLTLRRTCEAHRRGQRR